MSGNIRRAKARVEGVVGLFLARLNCKWRLTILRVHCKLPPMRSCSVIHCWVLGKEQHQE